jgi:hypothetical protein
MSVEFDLPRLLRIIEAKAVVDPDHGEVVQLFYDKGDHCKIQLITSNAAASIINSLLKELRKSENLTKPE